MIPTQERVTPFKNGIPGDSWLKWFRKRHSHLVLRIPQGLDHKRTRSLNPNSVAQFYENFESLYLEYNYLPSCIWNIDESGCQASQSGLGKVFAKRSIRGVHKTIPIQRKWLSILSTINANGESIPNYYLFKGVRQMRNYGALCEPNAMIGMQKKGWMDSYHFMEWMDHFKHTMEANQSRRHLLIPDGHKNHISLEVLLKAKEHNIDMITIPSHTSHGLQPLDKTCFRPFKVAFRAYRDLWNVKNHEQKYRKEDLAQWAFLALKRTLTSKNILSGFKSTRIWPFNPSAMTNNIGPNEPFQEENDEEQERSEILEEDFPRATIGVTQFYGVDEDVDLDLEEGNNFEQCVTPPPASLNDNHINQFL